MTVLALSLIHIWSLPSDWHRHLWWQCTANLVRCVWSTTGYRWINPRQSSLQVRNKGWCLGPGMTQKCRSLLFTNVQFLWLRVSMYFVSNYAFSIELWKVMFEYNFEFCFRSLEYCIISVSYTHLDVYKRQGVQYLLVKTVLTMMENRDKWRLRISRVTIPVSYTHLV